MIFRDLYDGVYLDCDWRVYEYDENDEPVDFDVDNEAVLDSIMDREVESLWVSTTPKPMLNICLTSKEE